jgi:hypothetical protein
MRLQVSLALLLAPSLATAQLRGVVIDGPAHAPIRGAVVTVLAAADSVTARAITDGNGAFTVARDTRAVKARVMKIGYRPSDVPLPAVGAPLQVVMERIPPMLSAVRVTDQELCPGSEDRGSAFQLWDQARAGLLATVVARDLKPATARTVMYESRLAPNDERVRLQTKHVASGRTKRPFVAAQTPSYFAKHGYIIDDPSVRIYNAPDADVLLDESFATSHCFHVQAADAEHPGQIGLAFSPSPGRDTMPDVAGVIWMDAQTPQLRTLDFVYTALERAATAMKAGGHVDFRDMPNGVSFIERWHLRLPGLEIAPMTNAASRSPRDPLRPIKRQDRTDYRVHEIIEAGGLVLDANWQDGTQFRATPAILVGAVTQRKTGAPVPNAIVALVGTPDTVLTDAAGTFQLTPIPGKYDIAVRDTALHAYVQSRMVSQSVDAALGHTTTVKLELVPIAEVIDDICRGIQVYDGEVVLLGHVFAPDRPRLPNAVVTATWPEPFSVSGGAIAYRTARRESDIDAEGRFVICGIPHDRLTRMRVSTGKEALADTAIKLERADLTQPFEWRIAPLGTKPPSR